MAYFKPAWVLSTHIIYAYAILMCKMYDIQTTILDFSKNIIIYYVHLSDGIILHIQEKYALGT